MAFAYLTSVGILRKSELTVHRAAGLQRWTVGIWLRVYAPTDRTSAAVLLLTIRTEYATGHEHRTIRFWRHVIVALADWTSVYIFLLTVGTENLAVGH